MWWSQQIVSIHIHLYSLSSMGFLFLTRGGSCHDSATMSSVPIRWRWGTRCTANFSAASTSCSFGDSKSWGGHRGHRVPTLLTRTETERNKPYSYVEQKTAVLCDEHPHVPSCVCVSFLASTTSDVCQTIKTSATPHKCLLRIVPCEPRAHAGLFQTLRTENQQRTSAMKGCFRLVVRSGLYNIYIYLYIWLDNYLHQMLAIIFNEHWINFIKC